MWRGPPPTSTESGRGAIVPSSQLSQHRFEVEGRVRGSRSGSRSRSGAMRRRWPKRSGIAFAFHTVMRRSKKARAARPLDTDAYERKLRKPHGASVAAASLAGTAAGVASGAVVGPVGAVLGGMMGAALGSTAGEILEEEAE